MRERKVDERLPWDHIDVLIDKQWFVDDWDRASALKHAQDCRHSKCHKCGVIDHERPLCASMLRKSIQGRKPEGAWTRRDPTPHVEPQPVQRLWMRISRTGVARYLTHLEAMNAWMRALRRAHTPLSYSQGFHPHPKMAFSSAMPHNEQSTGEYLDVVLHERVEPAALLRALSDRLPEGFGVHWVTEVPLGAPSLMSLNHGHDYTIWLPHEPRDAVVERVTGLIDAATLPVVRPGRPVRGKRGKPPKSFDLRPHIVALSVRDTPGAPAVDLRLTEAGGRSAKAREVVERLTEQPHRAVILRRDTLTRREGRLESLSVGWDAGDLQPLWASVAPAP
jgi:radical SAM-linked protein